MTTPMAEPIIHGAGLAEPETSAAFVPHKLARPEKLAEQRAFRIVSEYRPAGDQPGAIAALLPNQAPVAFCQYFRSIGRH